MQALGVGGSRGHDSEARACAKGIRSVQGASTSFLQFLRCAHVCTLGTSNVGAAT